MVLLAMIPENPVVGGNVLRRAAIQSPNFVSGATGWTIRQDGSAEFNNLVIRNGQIISGVALWYSSSPPALGNLIASVAASGGTDSAGNAYLPGATSYFVGATAEAVSLSAGALVLATAATAAGPYSTIWTINRGPGPNSILNFSPAGLVANANTNFGGGLTVNGAILQALNGLLANNGATVTGGLSTDTLVAALAVSAGVVIDASRSVSSGTEIIRVTCASAASRQIFMGGRVSGDTNNRLVIDVDPSGNPRILFGPGNAGADTSVFRSGANKINLATADLDIATTGRGLQIAEGANARMGRVQLVSGVATVNNTTVTANTEIFLSNQLNSGIGTPGFLRVSARTAGTSFTITSSSTSDTSTVAWLLVEPG